MVCLSARLLSRYCIGIWYLVLLVFCPVQDFLPSLTLLYESLSLSKFYPTRHTTLYSLSYTSGVYSLNSSFLCLPMRISSLPTLSCRLIHLVLPLSSSELTSNPFSLKERQYVAKIPFTFHPLTYFCSPRPLSLGFSPSSSVKRIANELPATSALVDLWFPPCPLVVICVDCLQPMPLDYAS